MKYSVIEHYNIQNGKSATVSVWTQGCHFHCKGCHNEHTWGFDSGKTWTEEETVEVLEALKYPFQKDFALLGGEPLCEENYQGSLELVKRVREVYPDIRIFAWTGYPYIKIKDLEIWDYIDIMIANPFILSLKVDEKWYGSSNQKMYCTNKEVYEWLGNQNNKILVGEE